LEGLPLALQLSSFIGGFDDFLACFVELGCDAVEHTIAKG
jgi:hypothetical protein